MAPSARPRSPTSSHTGLEGDEDEDYWVQKGDRKTRKPLVEKKRRARINESLLELRTLLADTDFHNKMENAEVLEMTVKKVEDILKNRTHETDVQNRESSERFAAGYIQCMHEVHMFVSSCPGIDATVAAELLNHLLECMPLNDQDHFQDALMDLMTDANHSNGRSSTWSAGEALLCSALASPGGRSTSCGSSSPVSTSGEDLSCCSDMDDTESEHNQSSCSGSTTSTDGTEIRDSPGVMPGMIASSAQSMWRPW